MVSCSYYRMLQIAITNKRLKIYRLSIFFTWFENAPKYIIIFNCNYFHKTCVQYSLFVYYEVQNNFVADATTT